MTGYGARAQAYAQRVVAGAEVAGQFERLACQRFIDDLVRQGQPDFPFRWSTDAGERCCRFLEQLPHIKGISAA